jgi:dienelactone hydrolase
MVPLKSRPVSGTRAMPIGRWVAALLAAGCTANAPGTAEQRVVIESDGWEIVGDLTLPDRADRAPVVLTLNGAAGNRSAYEALAQALADRGVATLRIDLRAHGESTNLGTFTPDVPGATDILDGTERDIQAAQRFLESNTSVDPARIGIVGASYSGEAMAMAGRTGGYARAYVALSPGSFSTESARAIDTSNAAWLFVRSRDERVSWVQISVDSVEVYSHTAEVWVLPGTEHAARILPAHPGLTHRIADWLQAQLTR